MIQQGEHAHETDALAAVSVSARQTAVFSLLSKLPEQVAYLAGPGLLANLLNMNDMFVQHGPLHIFIEHGGRHRVGCVVRPRPAATLPCLRPDFVPHRRVVTTPW